MPHDFTFTFISAGRPASCPPNPQFPNGMDIDVGHREMCVVDVPYPAEGCGLVRVDCAKCGLKVGFTVAGRVDDPRRVTMPCKVAGNRSIRKPERRPYTGGI